MAAAWDVASVKALLRTTSQRLGQLQDKNDAKANSTRREIATLLQQGNLGAARTKAQELMHEDAMGNVLEMLEMHVGMILERLAEFTQSGGHNPAVVEAASTIIYAAPHVDSKELHTVRDFLVQQLGADFARSAEYNRKNHVSPRVTRGLGNMPTTVSQLDDYLMKIAKAHNVNWVPEPQRPELLDALSEILHPNTTPVVDIVLLRKLCNRGIPDQPSWLRPRIWKLFFGTLPALKASWHKENIQQRANYYDLLRRLVEPFAGLPPPTEAIHPLDSSLVRVSRQLSSIPSNLFSGLEDQPDPNPDCPLDDTAPESFRIRCANVLSDRLKALRKRSGSISESSSIPEIRLENTERSSSNSEVESSASTLLPSRTLTFGRVHERHESALLRILYLHSSINPGNLSPHVPVLLAPLYSVLNQETDPKEVAHVEADTFWLFEALIAEFSELEDEEGGNVWMKKFSERLAWADNDLWHSLNARGLDPAQPHYSYRWLAPLLTYTLPYHSVIIAWDALFSCPPRQREVNHKLDLLLDICTSMLVRARVALIRLGKSHYQAPSSWGDDTGMRPPSPIRPWELGDAFTEGLALLKHYPVDSAGGIDRVLQVAVDLRQRREDESQSAKENSLGLGARLKVTVWKGFTNQVTSPDRSPMSSDEEDEEEEEKSIDDGNETETAMVSSPGLTSRLATTVWRGITNQSSMEPPPTPITPSSPAILGTPPRSSHFVNTKEESPRSPAAQSPSLLWGYAEKLKDSDAAATLAKVSSNWRAKALVGSWGIRRDDSTAPQKDTSPSSYLEPTSPIPGFNPGEVRRGSLPDVDGDEVYSPPPRPKHFLPPRDTMIFSSPDIAKASLPSSPELSPQSDSAFLQKTKSLQASLAALTRSDAPQPPPKSKSGPRPLLLNSTSLITATNGRDRPLSRSENSTPIPDRPSNQWSHVTNFRRHMPHRDSQSSISSLSPSDALARAGKMDWDSDGSASRRIPLNRRSISPMAPHARTLSTAQSVSSMSTDRGLPSPATSVTYSAGPASAGWGQVDIPDSPPISTPPISISSIPNTTVKINDPEESAEEAIVSPDPPLQPLSQGRKISRKNTPPVLPELTTSDSSAVETPSRSPEYGPRNIRLDRPISASKNLPTTLGSNLAVDWPDQDSSVTPKAASFDGDELSSPSSVSPIPKSPNSSLRRTRKSSASNDEQGRQRKLSDGPESRTRKISTGSRTRKISATERKRNRESAAEEGDDEGYDDLLSAYESEEGSKTFLR
ncbi:hypothetical protein VNI00_003453 [Paramarasmius palmivorus]|uniref:Rab-GAP TBC domain-containing protein n=1 Tax=Paramarasmius palmivorus TaxID=297713 RepID=A0AAW0DUR8_9AGAR